MYFQLLRICLNKPGLYLKIFNKENRDNDDIMHLPYKFSSFYNKSF